MDEKYEKEKDNTGVFLMKLIFSSIFIFCFVISKDIKIDKMWSIVLAIFSYIVCGEFFWNVHKLIQKINFVKIFYIIVYYLFMISALIFCNYFTKNNLFYLPKVLIFSAFCDIIFHGGEYAEMIKFIFDSIFSFCKFARKQLIKLKNWRYFTAFDVIFGVCFVISMVVLVNTTEILLNYIIVGLFALGVFIFGLARSIKSASAFFGRTFLDIAILIFILGKVFRIFDFISNIVNNSVIFEGESIVKIYAMFIVFSIIYLIFAGFSGLIVLPEVGKIVFKILNVFSGSATVILNLILLANKNTPCGLNAEMVEKLWEIGFSPSEFWQILTNGFLLPIVIIGVVCETLIELREYRDGKINREIAELEQKVLELQQEK